MKQDGWAVTFCNSPEITQNTVSSGWLCFPLRELLVVVVVVVAAAVEVVVVAVAVVTAIATLAVSMTVCTSV
jgi:hypothetical protein